MRKLTAMTGTAILALTVLAGCGAEPGSFAKDGNDCTPAHTDLSVITPGTITVATPHFPPFTEVDGTQLSGVEGDILEEMAAMECLTVTAQSLDSGSVIPSAQNGRADVAAGNWYCTEDRAKVVSLSPVYTDQMAIVSKTGADTFSDLEGMVVGTPSGYNWNDELKQMYGSNVKEFPNATALYTDLAAGRVDAALDSFGAAAYANKQRNEDWTIVKPVPDERIGSSLETAQVCFPVRKENKALLAVLDENLEKLRQEGKIAEILKEYGLDPSAADVGDLRLIR